MTTTPSKLWKHAICAEAPELTWLTVLQAFCVGSAGMHRATRGGFTAWEWPAIDMAPYFMRNADPSYAAGDFFTDASQCANPRQIFGMLISGLSPSPASWYDTFLVAKALLAISLPILLWLNLRDIVRSNGGIVTPLTSWMSVIALVFLLHNGYALNAFSIAWWSPLPLFVAAQCASLGCALLAPLMWPLSAVLGGIIAALGCLLHPVVGLHGLIFAIAMRPSWWSRKRLISVAASFVIPALFLAWRYRAAEPLPTEEFVRLFAKEGHPHHFILGSLETFTRWHWLWSYAGLIVLLFGIAIRIGFKSSWSEARAVALGALIYALCVPVQWLVTEGMPNKIGATLSPIRFSMFGTWMLAAHAWRLLGCELGRWDATALRSGPAGWLARGDSARRLRNLCFASAVTTLSAWAITVVTTADREPWQTERMRRPSLHAFLAALPSRSVVAAPPMESDLLTAVHGRARFVGDGFPFHEEFMREHAERDRLLYGSRQALDQLPGSWIAEKRAAFYRLLRPDYLREIATRYRLDVAVIEEQFADGFADLPLLFRGDGFRAYALSSALK